MKKIIILTLTALMMVGCNHQETKQEPNQEQIEYDYSVIVVDGCEYIEKSYRYEVGSKYGAMAGYTAHKGNCRFCAQRRKQELKELINQLK